MSDRKPKMNRRQFLTVTGLGGAASAAVVVQQALPEGSAPKPVAAKGKRDGKGYEVTEHIRNYYRTTQV